MFPCRPTFDMPPTSSSTGCEIHILDRNSLLAFTAIFIENLDLAEVDPE
jgi:hypothetical protein